MPETALFPLHSSHSILPKAHSSHDSLRLQRRRGANLAVGPSAYPINTVQVVPEGSSMMSRRHCSGRARAVFPCDDTYCRSPTLRQRQGELRKTWDFNPADNCLITRRVCAPVNRGRTPHHARSAPCVRPQPFHWPLSAKLYHFQPIQCLPVYIAPVSVFR